MLLLQALSGAAKTLEAARAARRLGPKAIARHVAKDTAKEAVKDYFDANGDEKKGGGGGGGAAAAAGGGSQWVELSPEDVAACAEAKVGRDIAKDGDRFWCAAAAPAAFGAGMTVIDAPVSRLCHADDLLPAWCATRVQSQEMRGREV